METAPAPVMYPIPAGIQTFAVGLGAATVGQAVAVGGPSSNDYSGLVQAIERSRLLIEELEALAPSAKRDQALQLLRERHGHAIRRIEAIRSESHRN